MLEVRQINKLRVENSLDTSDRPLPLLTLAINGSPTHKSELLRYVVLFFFGLKTVGGLLVGGQQSWLKKVLIN